MFFVSPNQLVASHDDSADHSGYTLLIHPDFFLTYSLAKKIKQYGFFSYSANEALHLSDNEKATIISIFKIVEEELKSRIDDFSQDVIISQIELLLNYSNRFYKRQFITRKAVNSGLLQKLEDLLDEYFNLRKLAIQMKEKSTGAKRRKYDASVKEEELKMVLNGRPVKPKSKSSVRHGFLYW